MVLGDADEFERRIKASLCLRSKSWQNRKGQASKNPEAFLRKVGPLGEVSYRGNPKRNPLCVYLGEDPI